MEPQVMAFDRGLRMAAQETVIEAQASRERSAAVRLLSLPDVHHWTLDESSVDLDFETAGFSYRKRIAVGVNLEVAYRLRGPGRIFSEWNLSLAPRRDDDDPLFSIESGPLRITTCNTTLAARHDADDLWVEPVIALCQTDRGIEPTHEGWTIVFARELATTRTTLSVRWSTP